jgi:N-acetyl-anhydromuramyl-L-alanine amidase AmpD
MIDIIDIYTTDQGEVNNNKNKIILTHTGRNSINYIQSLKYRNNKKYKKIPNFVITRDGKIIQTLSPEKYLKYFSLDKMNKESVVVSLENLGWLEKVPLKNSYINWIGDIYNGDIFERKWRDYIFWQPYTTEQIESCVLLCKKLSEDMSIKLKCIGHNTKINGAERHEGILTKSNFELYNTDLSLAFNFEWFVKKIEDE